jgi:hypothetical protein
METKLKSALRIIPWQLIVESIFIALAWFFLPLWVFILAAIYFYLSPLILPLESLSLFLIFLILALILPINILIALIIGIAFALILGIKNLIFIDRGMVSEIIFFLFFFLIYLLFFSSYSFISLSSIGTGCLIFLASYFLILNLIKNQGYLKNYQRLVSLVISFIIFQLMIISLLLPIDYYFKIALNLAFLVIVIDLTLQYLKRKLTSEKILIDLTMFFILIASIFFTANWIL